MLYIQHDNRSVSPTEDFTYGNAANYTNHR